MSKKRKKDDDEDWIPESKRKKSAPKKKSKYPGESCFIHITDSDEDLTKLPSLESWENYWKLLKYEMTKMLLD